MTGVLPAFIVFALLIFPSLSAAAEVLRWVDDKGVVHFTDAFSIPEQYRSSATSVRPAPARVEPDKASVSLQMRGNVAFVQALLNGSTSASLVVDTGSSSTVISRAIAKQLGIDLEGGNFPTSSFHTANGIVTAPIVMLESVEVGGMQVKGLMASVHDISPEVSGLLGLNFLSHFRMDIDNRSSLLHLEKK